MLTSIWNIYYHVTLLSFFLCIAHHHALLAARRSVISSLTHQNIVDVICIQKTHIANRIADRHTADDFDLIISTCWWDVETWTLAQSLRIISGTLHAITSSFPWLPVLSNVAPTHLRLKEAATKLLARISMNDRPPSRHLATRIGSSIETCHRDMQSGMKHCQLTWPHRLAVWCSGNTLVSINAITQLLYIEPG